MKHTRPEQPGTMNAAAADRGDNHRSRVTDSWGSVSMRMNRRGATGGQGGGAIAP